jgi:hypothetical protein
VSEKQPTEQQLSDLRFAWRCVKHVKSNAITVAKDNKLLGMGSGQPNRCAQNSSCVLCYVMLCYVTLIKLQMVWMLVKSNDITVAKDNKLLGMGSGQPNRCVMSDDVLCCVMLDFVVLWLLQTVMWSTGCWALAGRAPSAGSCQVVCEKMLRNRGGC